MPQLTIPGDTYERLARRAATPNMTVEQFITPALEHLAEEETANGQPLTASDDLPPDRWRLCFDEVLAIVQSRASRYPSGFQADVSRESIYEGCGE